MYKMSRDGFVALKNKEIIKADIGVKVVFRG